MDTIRTNYGIRSGGTPSRVSTVGGKYFAYDWMGNTIANPDFTEQPTEYTGLLHDRVTVG